MAVMCHGGVHASGGTEADASGGLRYVWEWKQQSFKGNGAACMMMGLLSPHLHVVAHTTDDEQQIMAS